MPPPLQLVAGIDDETRHAINSIDFQYNDHTTLKSVALRQFGRTSNVDVDVRTTVATYPNGVINETLLTSNDIDGIVSSSASDTESITLIGHTIDGLGKFTEVTQTVTLTGQTTAVLPTPLARCSKAFVAPGTFASPASDLVGTVYVFERAGVTVTAGVPQTDEKVHNMIPLGYNQSQSCATTTADDEYAIVRNVYAGVTRVNDLGNVEIEIEYREPGGVWLPIGLEMTLRLGSTPSLRLSLEPYAIIRPNSDIRMIAMSDAVDTTVTGSLGIGKLERILP